MSDPTAPPPPTGPIAPPPPAPPPAPSIDTATIATRAAAFASAGYSTDEIAKYAGDTSIAIPAPPPARSAPHGQPVTSGGSPPAPRYEAPDRKIHQMSPVDQRALANQIGTIAYKNRLWGEMASVMVNTSRRRGE